MNLIKTFAAATMLAFSGSAMAQSPSEPTANMQRPVTSVYNVELGGARDLSTYLSPLYYKGFDIALSGSWSKAFNVRPESWLMRFEGGVNFSDMMNPAKTARMYSMQARFNWGMLWRCHPANRWQVAVGPMLNVYGGALYLMRNSNNPVSVIASAGIDIAAMGSFRFNIGSLPVILSDELRIPTLSAFFNPEYGETYYEIYLGNHRGLAHCGWWGNAFGIDNLLSLKLDFGRTAMQVGYRVDFRSFWSDGLNTHLLRNAFVIGVIPGGLGLKQNKKENRYDY